MSDQEHGDKGGSFCVSSSIVLTTDSYSIIAFAMSFSFFLAFFLGTGFFLFLSSCPPLTDGAGAIYFKRLFAAGRVYREGRLNM